MVWPRFRGLYRRYAVAAVAALVLWACVGWLILPFDSVIILWLRFVTHRASVTFRKPLSGQQWLAEPPRFHVDFAHDVAVIIKTGYATQRRVPAQLTALARLIDRGDYKNTVIIADFSTKLSHDGVTMLVHDVLEALARNDSLAGHARIQKYKEMTAAVSAGQKDEATKIGAAVGWELDALKFIPGLELAYRRIPGRKWYMLLDDDTYMVDPSVRMILERLDPTKPTYLGNAVGDFKARFAHGGSSIILSGAAMSKLFDVRRDLISVAVADSLTETWGDKLVATTFMKVGVYLDERYSNLFNGEQPRATRILPIRFCSPIVSFHGLAEPAQMEEVGTFFKPIDTVVSWGQLWTLYGLPGLASLTDQHGRQDEDHVGRTDESTMTVEGVNSAEKCRRVCKQHNRSCLAWTWDTSQVRCHIAPWVIVGMKATGMVSGLNLERVRPLFTGC